MLAAGLSQAQALEYLAEVPHESAVVACVNSPFSVTLSGDVEAIDTLEKLISGDGKFARKLKVKTAYHSPHVRAVAQGYLERMGNISPLSNSASNGEESNKTIMYSTLTGKLVSPEELTPQYWMSNMCAPVEFSAAVTALLLHTTQTAGSRKKTPIRWGGIIEVGPHAALQGPVQQIVAADSNKAVKNAMYMSILLRGKDANETALAAAGQLWALGHDVDLSAVNEHERELSGPKALTNLPPYPWNHSKSFWHEAYPTRSNRFPPAPRSDLLGVAEDLSDSMEPRWRNHLRISENPWIEDHKITGTILYPGAGMLIMALEGALKTADPARKVRGFRFRNVEFIRGLVVPSSDGAAVETRLSLQPYKMIAGQFEFTIFTTTGSWTKHCAGTVALEYTAPSASEVEDTIFDAEWTQQSELYKQLTADSTAEEVDVDGFYDHLETIGMEYGPLFRNTVALSAIPLRHAAHATIVIPDTKSVMPDNFEFPHVLHPATMDAIFHLLLAAFNEGRPIEEAAVPFHINDMFVAAEQPQGVGARFLGYGQQVMKTEGGHEVAGDLVVSDETWSAPKLTVKGFALRRVTSAESARAIAADGPEALKCVRIDWSEDVDFIKSGEDVARLRDTKGVQGHHLLAQLSLWLDRLTHKKVVGEVLIVLDEDSCGTSDIWRDVYLRVGQKPGFDNVTATATSTAGVGLLRSILTAPSSSDPKLWDLASDEELPVAADAYDVVLVVGGGNVGVQAQPLAKLLKVLSPSGHLVFFQTEGSEADIKTTLQRLEFTHPISVPGSGSSNLLIASAFSPVTPEMPSEVYILHTNPTSPQVSDLLSALTTLLSSSNITVHSTTLSLTNMAHLVGKHIISLLEVESPLIYSWSEEQFTAFKFLISSANHLLWLTRGSLLQSWSAGVEFATAQGLLRVLRNEYPLITLPHLDLSAAFDPTSSEGAELIFSVWSRSLVEGAEMEYAELDGAIHVPRAVKEDGFDKELQLASGTAKPVRSPIHGSRMALKLSSSMSGEESLWVNDDEAVLSLGPREVEVEVEYVGLNTSDGVNTGREAVGIVSRCGEQVKSIGVGQRVAVIGTQACRTRIRQDEALVAPVPACVAPQEAAAVPSVFITAQYALLEVAGITKGQTVLLHSAASALGQAAIQIAQFVGTQVFALVGSKEEKQVLVEQYGIPPSRVFDSALQNFVAAILQATDGHGVNAVFSSQTSPATLPSLALLGDFGYFLDLSSADADSPEFHLPSSKRNASLIRIHMDHVEAAKADVIKALFQRTFQVFLRTSTMKPISPITLFSVSDTAQAFGFLKTQTYGKVVLSLNKEALVLTPPPPAPKLALYRDATYVLAGGLGALGLDIANMMAEHGAGHLVFLSRSGGSKNEKELEAFRAQGVNTQAFKCDVNDSQRVADVFNQLKSDGRVIKGLIQCAMVLEVCLQALHHLWDT